MKTVLIDVVTILTSHLNRGYDLINLLELQSSIGPPTVGVNRAGIELDLIL